MEIKLVVFIVICILLLKSYPVKDKRLETAKFMIDLISSPRESNLEKYINSFSYVEIYTKDGPCDIFEVKEFWKYDIFHKITSSFYENVHVGNEIIHMDVFLNNIKVIISFKFSHNKVESINIYFHSKGDINKILDTSTLVTMDELSKKNNIKIIMI